jgi:hypothetical protein
VTSPRRRFEQRVGPFVALTGQLPRWVPFLVVAVLLVVGLLAQGVVGAVLLLLLAVLLGSLLVLSWPALQPPARLLRLAVVTLIAVRAVGFLA